METRSRIETRSRSPIETRSASGGGKTHKTNKLNLYKRVAAMTSEDPRNQMGVGENLSAGKAYLSVRKVFFK